MRCAIVFTSLLFLLCKEVLAQSKNRVDIISKEFHDVNRIFDNRIFMVISDCTPFDFYEVLSIDTLKLRVEAEEVIPSPYLLTIKIKVKSTIATNLPDKMKNQFTDSVLTYQVLRYNTWNIRLFGFYNTDIMEFIVELGKRGTKSLVEKLVEVKALSGEQGKLFYEAIIKKEKEYPTALSKPCNILKYYFSPEEINRANTIILPAEPLRRITF